MEKWKPIHSLNCNYEASNLGRIRRAVGSRGTTKGRICAIGTMPAGYKVVSVQHDKQTVTRLVHRLVAEAFFGLPPADYEVNHKDSDKSNNRLENLEYVTRSENLQHAVRETGAYRGERNSQAIINEALVRKIREQHANGMGYKRLAKHFGLSWHIVRGVAARITWKHVM
jgi:hypothetical protein